MSVSPDAPGGQVAGRLALVIGVDATRSSILPAMREAARRFFLLSCSLPEATLIPLY